MKTLTLIAILAILLTTISACGGGGGGGGSSAPATDSTAPKVETFYPDPGTDGNVSSSDIGDVSYLDPTGIYVIFDEAVTATTVDDTSFIVEEWAVTPVTGTVTYDASIRTAKFVPNTAFNAASEYVVTVTTSVTDLAGNNLAAEYTQTITIANPGLPGDPP